MRKTIKYFEERLKNYKESLQKVNKRIRFIRKEVKNNKNLTENRKEVLNNSYGKLLKLKERLEKHIIECTAEYNIKWKNRNKRTEKKVKTFDDLQLINEEYIFKSLKERLLENIQPYKINDNGIEYIVKTIEPYKYNERRIYSAEIYNNERIKISNIFYGVNNKKQFVVLLKWYKGNLDDKFLDLFKTQYISHYYPGFNVIKSKKFVIRENSSLNEEPSPIDGPIGLQSLENNNNDTKIRFDLYNKKPYEMFDGYKVTKLIDDDRELIDNYYVILNNTRIVAACKYSIENGNYQESQTWRHPEYMPKNFMKHFYKDFLLPKYKTILSDSFLTDLGYKFWKEMLLKIVKDNENIKCGFTENNHFITYNGENLAEVEKNIENIYHDSKIFTKYFLSIK